MHPVPLLDPDVTYFVDGSCFRDSKGNHDSFETIGQNQFPTLFSSKGRIESLEQGSQHLYTDSAYAHGFLFGAVRKQRGFKKTDGSPILLDILNTNNRLNDSHDAA